MKNYTSDTPVWSDAVPIVEEDDLVNAENNNAAAKQLLQNVLILQSAKADREELPRLIEELYGIATEEDIDAIIGGTYVDTENTGGLFEVATDQDIDDIIGGTYEDTGEDPVQPDTMEKIVNDAFANA